METVTTDSSGTSQKGFELMQCTLPLLDEIYSRKEIPVASDRWEPMDVYIPREQGDFLYSLVRYLKPAVTVEVGMANGLSTCFIARALHDNGQGRHVAIDPFQTSDWKCAGLTLVEMADVRELVQLVEKPSHQALPEMEQNGIRAQFVFVDGSHLFDYVLTDFLCSDRILDAGGLMAFDDSDWSAISQVLRFVLENRHYCVEFPDIIIEGHPHHPTAVGRLVRWLGRSVPAFGAKLRPEFLVTDFEREIRGRCVVLHKLGEDDRDSQSRFHRAF